jgi:hypothetical protein
VSRGEGETMGIPGQDPSNSDITHALLARTGFATIAEMSQNIMFATKHPTLGLGKKPFRPGVPAQLKKFDEVEVDGTIQPCIILEYLDGMDGETIEYAHPLKTMFSELEFIARHDCSATYIRRKRLDKGL